MHALQKFLMLQALTCLGQNALGSEIINGKKVEEKSMLYMASVQDNNEHRCGGFLVTEHFVMTAAHCVDRKPKSLSVVLGTHNLKNVKKGKKIKIAKMCRHPSYKNVSSGNDIMLLKLKKKVRLDNKKPIQKILIPTQKINLKENICSVAGWGAIKDGGKPVDELQVVELSIINKDKCQKDWHGIPANVICASGRKTTKGICQGDSGGPLVCNKFAVGIVSYNNGCKYPDVPSIYTDISSFLPWINNILKKKKC